MTYPRYSMPNELLARLLWAVLNDTRRSFRHDAQQCISRIEPPLAVRGLENIPDGEAYLVTVNHYARLGFKAWWIAFAVSAVLPVEVHWVMTSAWTFPDRLRSHTLTPFSRWLFRRLARIYGFTRMPPMPPHPSEVSLRASAVRKVLHYARHTSQPVIGLAPEGGDPPDLVNVTIQLPPAGAGRFVMLLAEQGLQIIPAGVYESEGQFWIKFGLPYRIIRDHTCSPDRQDIRVRQIVTSQIASLLPENLRGEFRA